MTSMFLANTVLVIQPRLLSLGEEEKPVNNHQGTYVDKADFMMESVNTEPSNVCVTNDCTNRYFTHKLFDL